LDAIRAFLASPFEGGRHVGRVQKLDPVLAKQGAAGAKTTP
jgi:ribose 5-phosphate isomerase RpiB